MDFRKIKLENERCSHVEKRLNRLNTWNFFKVLYRENIWRLFGFSFLMVLCIAPIVVMIMFANAKVSNLQASLPLYNSFGFSLGYWDGVADHFAKQAVDTRILYGLFAVAAGLLTSLVLSGGFAVIRDGFWTGKLSKVGVFKSMGKGIAANIGYALATSLIVGGMVYGIAVFVDFAQLALPTWLWIILMILMIIVAMFVTVYLLILCSVSVTYKQSFKQNLSDSWLLLWMNVIPNLLRLVIALIPIGLYFLFMGGALQMLMMVFVFMFGGMYFPLVWQTYMMKTFALFHPVEVKKGKKGNKSQQNSEVSAEYDYVEPTSEPQPVKDAAAVEPTVEAENGDEPVEQK